MSAPSAEDLSKLQVICSLFRQTVGNDLYFAQQIKESIEASLSPEESDQTHCFIHRAKELVDTLENASADTGVEVVEAQTASFPFSLLDLRARLLDALKQICRFESGLVVLSGLKEAICPQGKRWSQRRKREYEDTIAFARQFCQQRSLPSSNLSLVIL